MKVCREKEKAKMPKSALTSGENGHAKLSSPYEKRGLAIRCMASRVESVMALVKAFLPSVQADLRLFQVQVCSS